METYQTAQFVEYCVAAALWLWAFYLSFKKRNESNADKMLIQIFALAGLASLLLVIGTAETRLRIMPAKSGEELPLIAALGLGALFTAFIGLILAFLALALAKLSKAAWLTTKGGLILLHAAGKAGSKELPPASVHDVPVTSGLQPGGWMDQRKPEDDQCVIAG
jgi:hypothetical protein